METIFDIFLEYGWGGILGIAAIGAIFLIIKYANNKLSDDVKDGMETIATNITTAISDQNKELISSIQSTNNKLIEHFIENDTQKQQLHGEKLGLRIDISDDINHKLKEILLYNNANRVAIFEFHNTSENLTGIPFAKYSCNFEWFDKHCTPILQKCQGLPFSSIASVIKDILNNDHSQVIYTNIEDEILPNNPQLYSMLSDANAKSVIYSAMYDQNNLMIGLLVLEYHNDIPAHVSLHELDLETAQLSSILNLRYKFNKD